MKISNCKLKDVLIIDPEVFEDDRGYFFESFNAQKFLDLTGIQHDFVQDNESKSVHGTLRGIHFQNAPFGQAKLVRVVSGKILDVVVDLRKESPTFGDWYSDILSAKNKKQLYVPKGFGHGFVVLSETAIFSYKVDNHYSKEHDSGIIWNDSSLNIDWQFPKSDLILSEKDKNLQSFDDFCTVESI